MRDSVEKFSGLTIALHWLVATGVIGMIALGFYMVEMEVFSLFHIHKSIGVCLLLVVLARVVWRLTNGFPEPLNKDSNLQMLVAKIVHWLLLLTPLAMIISGMVGSGFGGYGFDVFGLIDLVPRNPHPEIPYKVIPYNEGLAELGGSVHAFFAWTLVVLIVLHIAGGLKHHFINKDGTLRRMLGKKVEL